VGADGAGQGPQFSGREVAASNLAMLVVTYRQDEKSLARASYPGVEAARVAQTILKKAGSWA